MAQSDMPTMRSRRLAKEIHKVDWWSSQGPLLHDTLRNYLTLEADSELIRDPSVIPGLLQTEAYMSQIFATRHPADKVVQLVKTRMKRKELLDSHLDFRLRTIIDAPVLHRISGSSAVAREQLEHLLEMDGRPNINIHILPLDASIPAEQYAPFTLLSTGRQAVRDTKDRERGVAVFGSASWQRFVDAVRSGALGA
ncbi:DUF397 domain-containing protein [Streptomyces sp. NPDC059479]|uniref:DUF397 domain-containing protein n=1 Tax=Streptomyces sp. NPDC059479 TaxID=3346848 RepID=UPI0036C0A251